MAEHPRQTDECQTDECRTGDCQTGECQADECQADECQAGDWRTDGCGPTGAGRRVRAPPATARAGHRTARTRA